MNYIKIHRNYATEVQENCQDISRYVSYGLKRNNSKLNFKPCFRKLNKGINGFENWKYKTTKHYLISFEGTKN